MKPLDIRKAAPGEAGLVAHFYYKIFEDQFDFHPCVEAYFIRSLGEYFDAEEKSGLWVAADDEGIRGSICIIGKDSHTAQLRLFETDPSLQGSGIGKRLMERAMDFCRERGYRDIFLWTIDICRSALHLYEAWGFECVETKPNTEWADYDMVEERWECHLEK